MQVEAVLLPSRVFAVSDEELQAHAEFLRQIKNPLWLSKDTALAG
jgi:hypothetical protein